MHKRKGKEKNPETDGLQFTTVKPNQCKNDVDSTWVPLAQAKAKPRRPDKRASKQHYFSSNLFAEE